MARFFCRCDHSTSNHAAESAGKLMTLSVADGKRIGGLRKAAGSASRAHQAMLELPIVSANTIAEWAQRSPPPANSALRALERLGIVEEVTRRKRTAFMGTVNICKF